MAVKTNAVRKAGHPWDGRPGFDLLFLDADTQSELEVAVQKANKKFWQPWLIGVSEGTNAPGGVLYKPSGIEKEWLDSPESPHPGCSN